MSHSRYTEGRRNASRAKSSTVAAFLNPETMNHTEKKQSWRSRHKENLRYLKEVSMQAKQKQEEKDRQTQAKNKRFKLQRFASVDSKVRRTLMDVTNTAPTLPPHDPNNLSAVSEKKSGSTTPNKSPEPPTLPPVRQPLKNATRGMKPIRTKSLPSHRGGHHMHHSHHHDENISPPNSGGSSHYYQPKTKTRPPVPRRTDINILPPRKPTPNYLRENREKIIHTKPSQAPKEEKAFMEKESYGKVPEYIIQRRFEEAVKEKQRLEEAEKAKIPRGMRQMTEPERTETLKILNEKKRATELSIGKLPLTIETPSMIAHEQKLREDLREFENAIRIFSKKVVFVKADA